MPQQQGFAFEARITLAFGVDHVGQVVDVGIHFRGIHVHGWLGVEVAKTDLAVVDPHFVQGNGQQLA
ncbi:hypothetical protein D3C79_928250 [compost metagenome]